MDYCERIREIRNQGNTFARILGINTTEIREGYARGEMKLREEHMNINNSVHGGALYALADTVGGAAACSHGYRLATSHGNMDFLAAAMDTDMLICEAEIVKAGKRISVCEIKIFNDKNKLLAIGLFEYARIRGEYDLTSVEAQN